MQKLFRGENDLLTLYPDLLMEHLVEHMDSTFRYYLLGRCMLQNFPNEELLIMTMKWPIDCSS